MYAMENTNDCRRAQESMLAVCRRRSTGNPGSFTHKEANPVLRKVALGEISGVSPGFVEELFRHGASASVRRPRSKNILKRLYGVDQLEERSEVLLLAVSNCSDEVFQAIACHADQSALNDALPVAIGHNHPRKVAIILQAGGDVSQWCCSQFLAQVDQSKEEMVNLLLQGTPGVCQECRNQGLVRSARCGSTTSVSLLLSRGADVTYDSSSAMLQAARNGHLDVLATILSRAGPNIPPQLLDQGVKKVYGMGQYGAVELLLKAGARGTATDDTLIQAVKQGQMSIISTLIQHHASLEHDGGAAIQHAVKTMRPDVLRLLLRGQVSHGTIEAAWFRAFQIKDLGAMYEICRRLVDSGLRGDCMGEALIRVLNMDFTSNESILPAMVELLVFHGKADANLHEGHAFALAVASCRTDIIALLLRCQPAVATVNKGLIQAVLLSQEASRFEIVSMILDAGPSRPAIGAALEKSAGSGNDYVTLTSMLLKRSSVDTEGGRPLVAAIISRCLEQVEVLLTASPCQRTIAAAWSEIDGIDDDDTFQLAAYGLLLENVDVAQSLQDQSLVIMASRGPRSRDTCSLLLQNSASPTHLNGAAVVSAARNLDLETLKILAPDQGFIDIFNDAFGTVSSETDWITPIGLTVIGFLLLHGATGPEVDKAFCAAAKRYHHDAVKLLVKSISEEACNMALQGIMQHSPDWHAADDSNLWLIDLLIEEGADGETVHLAFLNAVSAYVMDKASEELIDTLLCFEGLDINFRNGEAFKVAVRGGNLPALEKLVSLGISHESLTQALGEILVSGLQEDSALAMIRILVKGRELPVIPTVVSQQWHGQPPLVVCLANHPTAAKLAARVIKLGCCPNSVLEAILYPGKYQQVEEVPLLAWALAQTGGKTISSEGITTLIKSGAKADFKTPMSNTTALILAARHRRADIIPRLIKLGADVSVRDYFDRSSLFYASRFGDLETVNSLIKASPPPPRDDGSLHEAARNLHSEVVTALISKGKHDPNFPSTKEGYEGRSSLQEMVYRCDSSRKAAELEATIAALVNGKARVLDPWMGQNALFLALVNSNPYPITRALLDRVMWRHVNDAKNVIESRTPKTNAILIMSPTIYLKSAYHPGDPQQNEALAELLYNIGAQDRYYAPVGSLQPPGAIGLPPDIQKAEDKRRETEEKRRDREYERQLRLHQEQEEAEHKAAIERQRFETQRLQDEGKFMQKHTQSDVLHQQQLLQKEAVHQQQVFQSAQVTSQQQEAIRQKHYINAEAAQKMSAQQLQDLLYKNQIAVDGKQQLANHQLAAERQKLALQQQGQQIAIAGKQQLANQQLAADRQKLALQQQGQNRQLANKIKTDNEMLRFKNKVQSIDQKKHRMVMQEQEAKMRVIKLRK